MAKHSLQDLKNAVQEGLDFWSTKPEYSLVKTCPKTEIEQGKVMLRLINWIEELEARLALLNP